MMVVCVYVLLCVVSLLYFI